MPDASFVPVFITFDGGGLRTHSGTVNAWWQVWWWCGRKRVVAQKYQIVSMYVYKKHNKKKKTYLGHK